MKSVSYKGSSYVVMLIAFFTLFININSPSINTFIYSIVMVPLAILLGNCTNKISEYIGEKKGGLLAATIGNFPELVMGLWAIKYGMVVMAKASLVGCILSNMLLGIGIAITCGGIKYGEQKFNKIIARTNFSMLILALCSMVLLAALDKYGIAANAVKVSLSIKIAMVLIFIYILGLVFSLYTHKNLFTIREAEECEIKGKDKNCISFVIQLIIITILLYFISEKLVGNVQKFSKYYNISEEFLGIILIPLLGNVGEMVSAIISAIKNKVNLSLETAIGSSIQMSLFVIPLMVIFSYFMNISMNLIFTPFQIIMAVIAVVMSYTVFQDGKTYWFEGAILIAIYVMITLSYYYVT